MLYVVNSCEHLRDGLEEMAKIFRTKEEALDWIEKIANGFTGSNYTFNLFELGNELPLKEGKEEREVEVVKKVTRRFRA